ncbi:MAG TPA: hypothetical protein PLZ08_05080 [Bacillota bacterium]|nr:hypothetical protein [Bacillota bacterium]HOL11157.1 hypothetical protein [Bacillota bacterium]HPO97315.1 hypothetical protein [Bacillota bacterium]
MKRYIGISLLLIVVLIVAGCGGNKRIVKERSTPGETGVNPVGGPKDDPVSKIIFFDDFESDQGWTTTGFWHRQVNDSGIVNKGLIYYNLPKGDTSGGNIPSAYDGNYCYWYGETDTGNYSRTPEGVISKGANSGTLTSPAITIPEKTNPVLTFMTWYEVESVTPNEFDQMIVKISDDDGASFKELYRLNPVENPYHDGKKSSIAYTSGGFDLPGKWVEVGKLSLSEYQGKTIKIQFEFSTKDDAFNYFRGWFIDLVKIVNSDEPVLKVQGMQSIRSYPKNPPQRREISF